MRKKITVFLIALILLGAGAFAARDYGMGTETTTPGPTTGPGPTTPTGPGGPGGGTATTETILEQTLSGTISEADLAAILTEAGFSAEQIEAAKELIGTALITQTIKVEKITSASGDISYKTTITIVIKNNSNMDWKDVKVIVEIPKAVATNASEITSPISFTALKADPILQFLVDIPSGTSKAITWSVAKNISATVANTIKAPIVASLREEVPAVNRCDGVNCDDANPCTVDSCNRATGTCVHSNVADETVCGTGMVCKAGQCVIKPTGGVVTPPGGLPVWAIALVIIIIIAAAGYYYLTTSKKKKK